MHKVGKNQQGAGRAAPHRRRHPQPPGPDRLQHHGRPESGVGLQVAAAATLMQKVAYYTTLSGAAAVAEAIAALKAGSLEVRPLQEYFA